MLCGRYHIHLPLLASTHRLLTIRERNYPRNVAPRKSRVCLSSAYGFFLGFAKGKDEQKVHNECLTRRHDAAAMYVRLEYPGIAAVFQDGQEKLMTIPVCGQWSSMVYCTLALGEQEIT